MPDTESQPEPLRIPISHSVRYAVRGLPEAPNQYGRGTLTPSEITLTYRAAGDSQLGRVHAYVAGRLWVDGAEFPLLPGGLYGQHYDDGLDGWPEWLAEEARLHDPDAVVPSAPADRAADAESVCKFDEGCHRVVPCDPGCGTLVPADRAARAAEAAVERVRSVLESEAVVGRSALDYRGLITSALMADDASGPSRAADEAQQPECPTPESHNWGCGCPGDRLPLYSDRGVDTPGCDCGHNGMGMRWHDGGGCAWFKQLTEEGRRLLADDDGGEAQQPETQAGLKRAHVALAAQAGRQQAALARIGQMTDHWEQHLPEVIRTPAVVSAIRAALELAAVPQPAKES